MLPGCSGQRLESTTCVGSLALRCRASKPINPAPALVFLGHPLWQRRRASEYDTLHVVGELERPHTLGRVVSQEEALAGPMRSCTCGSGCTCAHARHSCRGICTTSVGTEVVSDGGESAHCSPGAPLFATEKNPRLRTSRGVVGTWSGVLVVPFFLHWCAAGPRGAFGLRNAILERSCHSDKRANATPAGGGNAGSDRVRHSRSAWTSARRGCRSGLPPR